MIEDELHVAMTNFQRLICGFTSSCGIDALAVRLSAPAAQFCIFDRSRVGVGSVKK
jgi:hypothetical protein